MLKLKIFGWFRAQDDFGNEIPVKSKKAQALLAYLALPPGKLRSREELMALLWSDRGDEQARGSLRQVLSGLRRDLGDRAANTLRISDKAISLDPNEVFVENWSTGEKLLEGLHINDPAFDEWLRDERSRLEEEVQFKPEQKPSPLPSKPSIVVLPFVNLSNDPEQEYFADGITENVIIGLTRFRELFVIAMKSSVTAGNGATRCGVTDLGQVSRNLGVDHVVEGSVRRTNNRLRVTTQLTEAATGRRIWAEKFDRDLKDIFAVQDEITSLIVASLVSQIEDSGAKLAAQKPTENMKSYDYLLRGRQCQRRGTKMKAGELEARQYFERAIELDPNNSTAYAYMSVSYLHEFESAWTNARSEALASAFESAEKAVALDPANSVAWHALAWAQMSRKQLELATVAIERALDLNPNDYDNLCIKGFCLLLSGNPKECVDCMDQAIRVNPLAPVDCLIAIGIAEYIAHRYEAAIVAFGKLSGVAVLKHACLSACYAQLNRPEDARIVGEEALRLAVTELGARPGKEVDSLQAYLAASFPFKDTSNFDHLVDGLRKAGLAT